MVRAMMNLLIVLSVIFLVSAMFLICICLMYMSLLVSKTVRIPPVVEEELSEEAKKMTYDRSVDVYTDRRVDQSVPLENFSPDFNRPLTIKRINEDDQIEELD